MLNKVSNFYLYFKILLDKKILLILVKFKGLVFENFCSPLYFIPHQLLYNQTCYFFKFLFWNKTTNKFIKLRHNSMSLIGLDHTPFAPRIFATLNYTKYLKQHQCITNYTYIINKHL
jgi:hypothetical protein